MKNQLIISLVVMLLFAGACNRKEIEQLNQDKDSLRTVNLGKDSVINDMLYSFNEIQANLDIIKEKQSIISVTAKEEKRSEKNVDQINKDLQMINQLMEENNRTIAALRRKLKNSDAKISEMEKMLDRTLKQLEEKNMEIAELQQELISLNIKIEVLTASIDTLKQVSKEKDMVIDKKTRELNTAYYAIGTNKELKENNIVTKDGGFIGLGKTEKLSKDFNMDYFTKIDIREIKVIPLMCKKQKIVTTHATGSYKVHKKDDMFESIEILDPAAFWKASKYLVVVVD